MASLYLDRAGLVLSLKDGALSLSTGDARHTHIPLNLIDRIVISADLAISSRLIATLAGHGVGLLFLSPRSHSSASICGAPAADAARRLGQARMVLHSEWKSFWASRLARAKVLAQARLLQQQAGLRVSARMRLWNHTKSIELCASRLLERGLGVDSVRGLEGAASAAYFEGLGLLFAPALNFHGRNRRPPRDPVNAALSLLYTLLYGAASEAALCVGLDPGLGFLHEPLHGRAALACDLMEPLRPAADQLIVRLFQSRTLRVEHFHQLEEACLLGKAGRKVFYEAAEETMVRHRRRLRQLARIVAKASDLVSRADLRPTESAAADAQRWIDDDAADLSGGEPTGTGDSPALH